MKKLLAITSLFLLILCTSLPTHATILTFDLGYEYTGASPPSGAAPWLTAIFDDGGSIGSVTLTLNDNSLIGGEHVKIWLFNLNPALDPDSLEIIAEITSPGSTAAYIDTGANEFHAAGDGYFDIQFEWNTNVFGPAYSSAEFTISGDGLTAASFDFLSSGGNPDKGDLPTAAHIGGIDPNNEWSGWVTVPEPATMLLVGFSLIGLGILGRKKLLKRG